MSFAVGLLGGGKSQAQQQSAAAGITAQTSVQGKPIPLVYGTTRIAPNYIWYGDFDAVQQASSGGAGKGGVGGGGGGKGGGGSGTYQYFASFIAALCEGTIHGVNEVFVDKNITSLSTLGLTLFEGSAGQSPWGFMSTNHPTQALGYSRIAYVAAADYSLGSSPQLPNHNFEVEGIFSSVSTQPITDTQVIPTATPPGAFPGVVKVNFASTFVSTVSVTDSMGVAFTPVSSNPGSYQYVDNFDGQYTFDVSAGGQAGVTVLITYNATFSGDVDPSLVIADILTDPVHGVGFPSARLGNLLTYQAYCIASGLLISPAYTSQTQTSSMIDDIAKGTNSAVIWSNGQMFLVPYGDQNITANGYTYTAPSAPLYSLTDDDFLPNQNATGSSTSSNTDPVLLTRMRKSDQLNSLKLEYLDRSNSYNTAVIEAQDLAMITTFGLRQDSSRTFHMFCNGNAARLSVQLQLQREAIRNIYQFTLDQRYIVLDPMDIVAISDANLGLVNQWVRINEITENDDLSLSVTAEEYLQGTGNAPLYNFQSGAGFEANYNADPGNANVPVILEPPVQITAATDLEVWIGVSGGPLWGGCDIWISTDANSYKLAGRVTGPARQGLLTAILASSVDPDTTVNAVSVDFSQSFGELLSGTQADADALHTLCYVDGEFISYETATLTALYQYNLTYLRRGAYGSTIGAHAIGTQFLRLDNGVFPYSYDKSKIGTTIYIKLLSFNIYGGAQQALSDVEPYTHLIAGPPLPGQVQGFTAEQQGNVVAFAWIDLPNDVGLKGYDIAYGIPGSIWSSKKFLTQAHRGTEVSTASVPPGTWEFSIRGHDIADNLSPLESLVTLTVTNPNTLIYQHDDAPDFFSWDMDSFNMVRHHTGKLIPISSFGAAPYLNMSDPSAELNANFTVSPVMGQVAGGALAGATYYVKFTLLDLTGESTASSEFTFAVSAGNVLTVALDPNLMSFDGNAGPDSNAKTWNVYVGLTSGSETLQNVAPLGLLSTWTMPAMGLAAGASPPTFDTTGDQVFGIFVPDPIDNGSETIFNTYNSFITPSGADVDTGYNANLRVYVSYKCALGPGQPGPLPSNIEVDIETWLTGQTSGTLLGPWTIGYVFMRYLYTQLQLPVQSGQLYYLSDYTVTVDNPADVENFIATVAPGGSTVTFPTQFHAAPFVTATVIGAAGLYADATSVTATNCIINVYDHTATSVGGTVSISATGA